MGLFSRDSAEDSVFPEDHPFSTPPPGGDLYPPTVIQEGTPSPKEWVVCYHSVHGGEAIVTRRALEKVWKGKGFIEGQNPNKTNEATASESEQ